MNKTIQNFRQTVFDHFQLHGRSFPWRETQDPYAIWISEIMLQQTQTDRVVPKYTAFLRAFPTPKALEEAEIQEVLKLWQGLGYNRRGIALHNAAKIIMSEYRGKLPQSEAQLRKLPGIGTYTSAAICAFAYNLPVIMIETNIRRAFIHHFFSDQEGVSDSELFPLIEQAVDHENPRIWYYALMDYGAWLAKQVPNPNRRSKHYTKQGTFAGSNRQLRGMLVRLSLQKPDSTLADIVLETGAHPEKITALIHTMQEEGFPLPFNE